ncbi:unnamed protein product, partial [marine sediment metagenome]
YKSYYLNVIFNSTKKAKFNIFKIIILFNFVDALEVLTYVRD